MKIDKLVILAFLAFSLHLPTIANSQALKICKKNSDNTIVARARCKKSETRLDATSLMGPQGTQGERGVSIYDQIPSGQTVTGTVGYDDEAPSYLGDFWLFVTLNTSHDLTNENVIVVNNSVVDNDCSLASCLSVNEQNAQANSGCSGTIEAPTAPAGKVCIYPHGRINSTNIEGRILPTIPRQGFQVRFDNMGSDQDLFFRATWADTAP